MRLDVAEKLTAARTQVRSLLKRHKVQKPERIGKAWTLSDRHWLKRLSEVQSILPSGARIALGSLLRQIEALEQEKVVAAAGCASTILAHAGVLEGRRARICTADAAVKQGEDYCELLTSLGAICVTQGIVRDGLIITDRPRSYNLVAAVVETLESLSR